jgi:heavy metal translocating P-type ATPase
MAQARRLGLIPDTSGGDGADASVEPAPATRVPVPREALRNERFLIEGLSCPSCAWLVSVLLERKAGVVKAEADFMSDSVSVSYDMRRVAPDELFQDVSEAGYFMQALRDDASPEETKFSRSLARFVFALFLAVNIMMLSAVHWASYLAWIPAVDITLIAILQLGLIIPLVLIGIWPLVKRSLQLVCIGRLSMDLLFVLGFSAAFVLSLVSFFMEGGQFYFDACAAFVSISLFGRLVEGRLRFGAVKELRALLGLSATKVAVVDVEGMPNYQPLEQVRTGDRIRIPPEHPVPFDCVCENEMASISEAMLTGEPAPLVKHRGDTIWAGSTVLSSHLDATVQRPFQEGRLQRIADSMAEAMSRNEMRLRSADQLASWFVPVIMVGSAATFAFRAFVSPGTGAASPEAWLPTIAVLLVACPCGFGIALASALAVSVSALLKRGVLVKDGGALELLDRTSRLALDKTGTLTTGLWRIQETRWFSDKSTDLLEAVAGAESQSEHPVALSLYDHLVREVGVQSKEFDEIEEKPGQGIVARLGSRTLSVGSAALFEEVPEVPDLEDMTTVVYFGWGRSAAGCFLLRDAIRKESKEVVHFFRDQGVHCVILSGDRESVVRQVARELDIQEAHGGLTPEQKSDYVVNRMRQGEWVTFAGDGSNDGPAMAESQVAVALRHGTDLSLAAASIVPLSGELAALPRIFLVARRTRRTIQQNYGWAFAYNLIFLPLAAMGYLHPIFAAGLMFLSSTTVLLHSLRLRAWIERLWENPEAGKTPKDAVTG